MPCGVFISYQPGDWRGPTTSRSPLNEGIACRLAPRDGAAEAASGMHSGRIADPDPLARLTVAVATATDARTGEGPAQRPGAAGFRAEEVQTPAGLATF